MILREGRYDIFLRPFLTRKFFQEILGLEGSKFSSEKKAFLNYNGYEKNENIFTPQVHGISSVCRGRARFTQAGDAVVEHISYLFLVIYLFSKNKLKGKRLREM